MSSRRIPLTNIPNATNSPYRAVAAAAEKRSRSHSSLQREVPYAQPPPAKRQMVEREHCDPRTPPRQQAHQITEGRVFNNRRAGNAQLTAFDRKLVAARDKQDRQRLAKTQQAATENLENVRQWQKHYRKVFPQFVFYFESVPEEVRARCSKQVTNLGAREEKFFSKNITHVITTRSIPPEQEGSTSTDTAVPSSAVTAPSTATSQPQTINPSLLERSSEAVQSQSNGFPSRQKFTFEATLGKRLQNDGRAVVHPTAELEARRPNGSNGDVLSKAREMGMKIWALEKLQRMMTTMFDTETGAQSQHGHNTRSNVGNAVVGATKGAGEADLSQLLRNERLNGPSDRDKTVSTKEMVPLKGPYIYVRDLEEKARPIMVREYAKVAHKEDGSWPQFRSVGNGKCPFVEEVIHSKRDYDRARAKEKDAQLKREVKRTVARTNTGSLLPRDVDGGRALTENDDKANRAPAPARDEPTTKLFDPPAKIIPAKRGSPERIFRPAHNQHVGEGRAASRLFGGEPVASGLQQSNITSAIRSQMISSTAAAPGAKAGTSKEVYELKRKVLEKNSIPSAKSFSSNKATDSVNAAKNDKVATNYRVAKRKAQAKLGFIDEDFTPSEEEENARQVEAIEKARASQQKKSEKRDPKPGYCENCRDKFADFDEHTLSRKHRKFAVNNDNWSELDALLMHLGRPLKE